MIFQKWFPLSSLNSSQSSGRGMVLSITTLKLKSCYGKSEQMLLWIRRIRGKWDIELETVGKLSFHCASLLLPVLPPPPLLPVCSCSGMCGVWVHSIALHFHLPAPLQISRNLPAPSLSCSGSGTPPAAHTVASVIVNLQNSNRDNIVFRYSYDEVVVILCPMSLFKPITLSQRRTVQSWYKQKEHIVHYFSRSNHKATQQI